ncbi:hypothetical protein BZL30_7745 [Mycobacterium kansasii]|uniref:Uncharacterized protein n=1 Tax=Mycobacterium kansasii TaxID=1768 RepID=A0A1V3WLE0_MYCKA|nr:hypothetical protein BZL30_7745 [Mycobacterium kansasii]
MAGPRRFRTGFLHSSSPYAQHHRTPAAPSPPVTGLSLPHKSNPVTFTGCAFTYPPNWVQPKAFPA